jgi:hypothetical protein
MIIIDVQSVKNTDTVKEKGYDSGKNISGIKRPIAVFSNGSYPLFWCIYVVIVP